MGRIGRERFVRQSLKRIRVSETRRGREEAKAEVRDVLVFWSCAVLCSDESLVSC